MSRLLTIEQVCRELQVHRTTLWRRRGDLAALGLKPRRIAGQVRFRQADLDAAIERAGKEAK